jgi:folate-binding protein YgfZ
MSVYIGTRDVVQVQGPEAVSYLQGQISQDVEALHVGDHARSLILQPQGKVDAWFRITRIGDDSFLLDVDAGYGAALLARLQRFLMRTKVEMTLTTWDHHAYRGEVVSGDAPIVAGVQWGEAGTDVIGPSLPAATADLLTFDEYDRLRIEAGVPAMGAELTENTIPAEAGVVNDSVSFTKGCYTGQELVARVDSRGNNTPRSLHVAHGTGEPPAPGSFLVVDGADAAGVTSVSTGAPDRDDWVALVYLKRSFSAPLVAQGPAGEAAIEAIGS